MIMFIGQTARGHREREAFQELDYRRIFGQVAKWAAELDSADRIPEFVARAFRTATSGRPGPVVLAIPRTCSTRRLRCRTRRLTRRPNPIQRRRSARLALHDCAP
jgi:acetolactate synthase I/II/III large subunit